jgi:hypothetical protein
MSKNRVVFAMYSCKIYSTQMSSIDVNCVLDSFFRCIFSLFIADMRSVQAAYFFEMFLNYRNDNKGI